MVRAAIEWRRGRPEAALRELGDGESTRAVENYGLESYLRAEILRALGRDREALDWYTVQPAMDLFSPLSLAPSLLHRAEIHARLGEHREAVRCYSRFVALWKDADPELQPLVAHARRELARLTSG